MLLLLLLLWRWRGPPHQCLWFIVHSCDVSMCSKYHIYIYLSVCTRRTANQLLVACPPKQRVRRRLTIAAVLFYYARASLLRYLHPYRRAATTGPPSRPWFLFVSTFYIFIFVLQDERVNDDIMTSRYAISPNTSDYILGVCPEVGTLPGKIYILLPPPCQQAIITISYIF